ncbi:unnamed protein product, partial [Pelagomonas calceolata]
GIPSKPPGPGPPPHLSPQAHSYLAVFLTGRRSRHGVQLRRANGDRCSDLWRARSSGGWFLLWRRDGGARWRRIFRGRRRWAEARDGFVRRSGRGAGRRAIWRTRRGARWRPLRSARRG